MPPIYSIIKDQDQNIWLGTYGDGLNYFDPLTRKFVSYKNDPLDPNSIIRNYVYSLFESNDGIIWIATREAGIDRIDPKLNRFKHINHKLTNNNSLSNNVVKAVVEGPGGNIWIGTFGGGPKQVQSSHGRVYALHTPKKCQQQYCQQYYRITML